jgi:hypothetical protein
VLKRENKSLSTAMPSPATGVFNFCYYCWMLTKSTNDRQGFMSTSTLDLCGLLLTPMAYLFDELNQLLINVSVIVKGQVLTSVDTCLSN